MRRLAPGKYVYPRYAESLVRTALRDTRVVAISGPRQSGKTTLARRFAGRGRTYLTLDSQPTLAAAKSDPVAFIRGLDRAVIDEVQRAPGLLLTGSANLLTIKTVNDSLAGRVEVVPLYPVGRAERIRAKAPQFIAKIFRGQLPQPAERLTGDKLLQIVATGGYPDAIKRRSERRRQDWYRASTIAIKTNSKSTSFSRTQPAHIRMNSVAVPEASDCRVDLSGHHWLGLRLDRCYRERCPIPLEIRD